MRLRMEPRTLAIALLYGFVLTSSGCARGMRADDPALSETCGTEVPAEELEPPATEVVETPRAPDPSYAEQRPTRVSVPADRDEVSDEEIGGEPMEPRAPELEPPPAAKAAVPASGPTTLELAGVRVGQAYYDFKAAVRPAAAYVSEKARSAIDKSKRAFSRAFEALRPGDAENE